VIISHLEQLIATGLKTDSTIEMWANTQRHGRPAELDGALCSTPQSLADAQYWNAVQ